jgi:hypothetical protein
MPALSLKDVPPTLSGFVTLREPWGTLGSRHARVNTVQA